MPTITASRSMIAWPAVEMRETVPNLTLKISRLVALLMFCAACGAQAADSQITINDLTVRADAGDRTAMRALAEACYAGQDGTEQDFTQAADWYRRLAKTGDPRAQTSIGLMYARGYGVTKNLAEARRWWNFAVAQRSDADAQAAAWMRQSKKLAP